ncbi:MULTISPECIES: serine/threonine-protein kinase [Sorangium]|uniref:Protein kinase n=1 Tax=Sorangium cellulosum TaxID=56 RepID=A0A4P2R2S0_SORCE|nr:MULTISPECIES: serine/threonine-protein kinase [Sorangium]AUX36986.1 protein kinase [Sorangium cellulosum]WCQ96279.1 serine-threonine kinase [Sorangium sp. Soce836]
MSAPPGCPVSVGEVIADKYRVEDVLGKGGMGLVVKATHLHLRKSVAIKFLLPQASSEVVERFRREARLAAGLSSEHVVRVIDVADLPSRQPYMVMEFLEGKDLSRVLRQDGPLSILEAASHVLGTCEAIAEAHAMNIVHRDLKPANLFLANGAGGLRTVKVLDFGISKAIGDAADGEQELMLTKSSALLGSPLYMSPEQLRSARDVDQRSDIWSVGALFYEILTGRAAFPAQSLTELIVWVHEEPPTPPGQLRPDLPRGLEQAILRCLQRNPVDRFQNIAELAWAIAPFGPPEAGRCAVRASRFLGLPLPQPAAQAHDSRRPPPSSAILVDSSARTSVIPQEPAPDADAPIGMESTIRADNASADGSGTPAERRSPAFHAEGEGTPPRAGPMRTPEPGRTSMEQSKGRRPATSREKQAAILATVATLAAGAGIAGNFSFVPRRAGDVAEVGLVAPTIRHAASEVHHSQPMPIAADASSNADSVALQVVPDAGAQSIKLENASPVRPRAPEGKQPKPPVPPPHSAEPAPSNSTSPPEPTERALRKLGDRTGTQVEGP